jgi:hypothetical protein
LKAPADASLRPPGLADAFLQPMMCPMPPSALSCAPRPILAIYLPKRQLFEFDKPIRAKLSRKTGGSPDLFFVGSISACTASIRLRGSWRRHCLEAKFKPKLQLPIRETYLVGQGSRFGGHCLLGGYKEVGLCWWLSTSPRLVYIPTNGFCLRQSNHVHIPPY